MFVLPDVEDPPTPTDLAEPMELEEEDLEWQKWLSDLFKPSSKWDRGVVTLIPMSAIGQSRIKAEECCSVRTG